ncbi:MAG TPA: glycoside hydrolase family 16 protein [Bacteroidales bacterium]|nr:glycoside hydrolase family 16 protein [Bacteroidales bacterium]HQB21841.1 glycoside hydrolase family 16 protein [Bacteroidales bacterium]
MKKAILLIPLLFGILTFGQTPVDDPHWELVWEDHFNNINPNIWLVQNNFDHYGLEVQVYTDRLNNVFVSNDTLVIRVRNETYSCPAGSLNTWGCVKQYETGQPYNYTSGWIETKQAYNIQYGYIEARVKLPYGYGFWPAFWTSIGNGVSGPSNVAEIDIFEMLGGGADSLSLYNTSSIMTTNYHLVYPSYNLLKAHIPISFDYTQWHTYAIEWSPSKIIWYLDGYPIRLIPNPGIVDPIKIILNFAIRPDYLPNQTSPFPSDMLIDFVKVYKLRNDCNTVLNACNYNFGMHDNKVKRSITIGNNSCVNSLGVGQSVFLRASEGVLINGDFTVPIGAELYIDVNACY